MDSWRENQVHSALVAQLGFIPGEVHYAAKGSGVPYGFLRDDRRLPASRLHVSISDALAAAGVKNGNNNVVMLTPDSHTQAASIAWNKNMTHLVGMYPPGLMNLRPRIGHSANFADLLAISGYGNLMRAIYLMHGRGDAANLHCIKISGERNVLDHVHAGGPMHATESGTAGYSVLELAAASECYFRKCVFGTDTIARTAANAILRIGAASYRNVFEDCIFLLGAGATTPYFIEVLNTNNDFWTMFKNCQFISQGTALAVGILNSSVGYAHKLLFDSRCNMFNVTAPIAAAGEASVLIGSVPYAASAVGNLKNVTANEA